VVVNVSLARSQSTSRLWPLILLALIGAIGLSIYFKYTQTVVDGWDPLAYLYAGERIAEGKGPTVCHPYNEAIGPYFTLAGFNVRMAEGECLYLNYPPGFPLLLAAVSVLTGLRSAALYVPAALGVLGILVTFALGAVLFDRWVGVIGAGMVALTPTYLSASTSPWSDLAGAVFVMGGIALYLWGHTLSARRTQWSVVASVGGGALVVYSFFIRYTSAIALLPLMLYGLVTQKKNAFKHIPHWLFGGVIVLGFVGILGFNRVYYGGYLTTSYSPRHGWYTWPALSLRYALGPSPADGKSLIAVFKTLAENWSWLLIPGLIGLVAMPCHKRLFITGLILSFTLFYGFYAFAPQGINARFLLPAFPALALAVAYGLRYGWLRWSGDRKSWAWALAGSVLFVVALGWPLPDRLQALQERNDETRQHVQMVQALVEHTEPDAVFLAYSLNDPIFFYGRRFSLFYRRMPPLDPVTGTYRWDQLESRLVEVVNALLRRGVPVYYVQDSEPPFADSLNILTRHFILSPQGQTPPFVYRVRGNSAKW